MSGLPAISGEFGVVQEPEMQFGKDGKPWLKIRGVAKSRRYDKDTSAWVDGAPCYLDLIVDGKMAEHTLESINVGDSIVVEGELAMREWEAKDGGKRKDYNVRVTKIGKSMRFSPLGSAGKTSSGSDWPPVAPIGAASDGAPF